MTVKVGTNMFSLPIGSIKVKKENDNAGWRIFFFFRGLSG
jgi:hypothetical protein